MNEYLAIYIDDNSATCDHHTVFI